MTKAEAEEKEKNTWQRCRKAIEALPFWKPLRRYYFEQCTNGSNPDWADSTINDCQNQAHRLVATELLTELDRIEQEILENKHKYMAGENGDGAECPEGYVLVEDIQAAFREARERVGNV